MACSHVPIAQAHTAAMILLNPRKTTFKTSRPNVRSFPRGPVRLHRASPASPSPQGSLGAAHHAENVSARTPFPPQSTAMLKPTLHILGEKLRCQQAAPRQRLEAARPARWGSD